jgi:hypothetical protein
MEREKLINNCKMEFSDCATMEREKLINNCKNSDETRTICKERPREKGTYTHKERTYVYVALCASNSIGSNMYTTI